MVTIYNDNRSEHSQVWFVIIQVINKIRQLCSRSQICLIMSIIPDQIGHDITFCNQLIITIKNCDISSLFVNKTQYLPGAFFLEVKMKTIQVHVHKGMYCPITQARHRPSQC